MKPLDLFVLVHIKRYWLPYIKEHPDKISRDYYQVLKQFPKSEVQGFRGLFDDVGSLQAAAVVDPTGKPLFLNLLLTAPWRTPGSGSRLLYRIIQESRAIGSGGAIELQAAPTAIAFYLKYGFTIIKPAEKPEWDTPMRLTAEAAKFILDFGKIGERGLTLPAVPPAARNHLPIA